MRVLITGHRGYVGSVLTTLLQHARFDVVGLDNDLLCGEPFGRFVPEVPSFQCDIRDLEAADLLSFDAVVHLAAVGGNGCEACPAELMNAINHEASVRLAECCISAGVERMVMASTFDVFGRTGKLIVDESDGTCPTTVFARSKLNAERDIGGHADRSFCPVFLRFGEAYGVSPQLRLDLTVNDFVASAVTAGRIVMNSPGGGRRALVHVEDLVCTFAACLTAPVEKVFNEVFHVARREENYRFVDVADLVCELVTPSVRLAGRDVFDGGYGQVEGAKLQRVFPKLDWRWTLSQGIRQLRDAMLGVGLTPGDRRSARFRRDMWMQELRERGEVDATLRRSHSVAA